MELNPFSWEFHEDPYPTYRWLRDHAPLYRNEAMRLLGAVALTATSWDAFVDWETYSSAAGTHARATRPEAHFEMHADDDLPGPAARTTGCASW